ERLGYPVNFYDRYANPTDKPEVKTVDANVTSKVVLENYIKAIGGQANLDKVASISALYEGTFQGAPVTLTRKQTNKGQMLVSLMVMGQEMMKQVVTADKGYMSQQGQKMELAGEELAEMQKEAVLFPELKDLAQADQFTLSGIENFNGEDAYVLKKEDTATYFSVATGLKLVKVTTVELAGQTSSMTQTSGNYKEVKGIKIPHAISLPLATGMNIDLTVKDVKVNEGVSDADFQ